MTNIRKLPTNVVSRIAAGEVVERPMNIVKELVENSLDADADEIIVTIADGGRDLIRVQDNGTGIATDELDVAFQLHTTSKMETDDPSVVATLGFRGEALASIAAVSRIETVSKSEDEAMGRKLVLEGGKIIADSQVAAQKGTSIEVSGIFFNTPARRKFLKTASTERKRITDLITNYALMYPDIHFKLDERSQSGQSKVRVESPSRKSMMAVIYDILGYDVANELVGFDATITHWQLEGYISKPNLTRSDRGYQFINVNGRPIRHKELQTTIEEAYGSQLMRSAHPIIILKINGPIAEVDFNIHPQKSEIRFKDNEQLLADLPELILDTLSREIELPSLARNKLRRIKKRKQKPIQKSESTTSSSKKASSQIPTTKVQPDKSSVKEKGAEKIQTKPKTMQTSLFGNVPITSGGGVQVLGHVMNKFGVVLVKDELWLVDVHAADERVKFEMYSEGREREMSSQTMLSPISISISGSDHQLLLDHKDKLRHFGLRISNGGSNKILVHSMPVYYDQEITPQSIQDLLYDIIAYFNDEDTETAPIKTPLDAIEYSIISRLACHGAIRSGYPVAPQRVRQVIDELLECEFPWTCAHGRPTVLRLDRARLEGFFKR